MTLLIGLLIPLLGTMLGAAFVFLMKDEMSPRLQKTSYHALDTYLPRLVRAGHRVAICDQLEEPKGSAKVVEMVEPVSKKRSSKKASQEEMFTKA